MKRAATSKRPSKAFPKAWIALGSNLGNPPAQLYAALERLRAAHGLRIRDVSGFYRTKPVGPPGQSDYCNAVCEIETALEPEALLDLLQGIEKAAGRVRRERWGPRVLDLDLLHIEGHSCATPRLTLPHPELHRRAFVLVPLAEIAPDLEIPGQGRVRDLAEAVDKTGVAAGFASG